MKKDEDVKYIGQRNIPYLLWASVATTTIVIILLIILGYWMWESPEEPEETETEIVAVPEQAENETMQEEPEVIETEEPLVENETFEPVNEIVEEEPEEYLLINVSKDALEDDLAQTKSVLRDLFNSINKAKSQGKDIEKAKKTYGEAYSLYYRAILGLKEEIVDIEEEFKLSRESRKKAEEAKKLLP